MTRNPLLNAIAAIVYIVLVACTIYFGPKIVKAPDSVLIPIAFLSLFVLSAAVMGLIFFMQPVQFYIDGEKQKGIALLVQTVVAFAGFTLLSLLLLAIYSWFT